MSNELNKKEVDEILQKYGKRIISICSPVIKAGSPIKEYSIVKLMIELSAADDNLSYMIARKVADKHYGIGLTEYDFSKSEDEPANLKTVFSYECSKTGEIRPSIENLKNAEQSFNDSLNKIVEFATRETTRA